LSLIKPFNGIRPKKKFVKEISSPNINYLKNFRQNKKLNYLNILNNKSISKAKKLLRKLEEKKIIQQDNSDNFYLYRITNNNKMLLGIVGKINLNNYDDKNILGHEKTFSKRIKKRKEQLIKFNSQITPIYTAYKSNKSSLSKLKKLFKSKPNYNFKSKDKCKHELWIINTSKFKKLVQNYLNKIKKIYICDGHHRIQAMLKSGKKISPMVIAFPHEQVNILDYNRVLKTNLKFDKIKKIILKNFSLRSSNNTLIKKGEIEMYLNKKWFLLRPLKKLKDLDVTVLKRLILNKILRNNNNLQFVSGIKGKKALEKLVNTKKYNIAFKLYPTDISQVISFAEKKKFMPQKSTWFHPKPLDGLISCKIIS
jgi:uncharacterized protein (DUF1015 family)